MNLEINEQEAKLILELIDEAEIQSIRGIDHADTFEFKDILRDRAELLASLKEKITGVERAA